MMMDFSNIEKRIAAHDGTLKTGMYWIKRHTADGVFVTIARYSDAYSWEDDKRKSFYLFGDNRRYFQTENPQASNVIQIGDYVGEEKW